MVCGVRRRTYYWTVTGEWAQSLPHGTEGDQWTLTNQCDMKHDPSIRHQPAPMKQLCWCIFFLSVWFYYGQYQWLASRKSQRRGHGGKFDGGGELKWTENGSCILRAIKQRERDGEKERADIIKFHHLLQLGSRLWSGFKAALSDALRLHWLLKRWLSLCCFIIRLWSIILREHIPAYAHTHTYTHSSFGLSN